MTSGAVTDPGHDVSGNSSAGHRHDLTGLRGVLALWVVLYHFVGTDFGPSSTGPVDWMVARGYLAVDAFFILSGVVIALVYGRQFASGPTVATWRLFLRRRLARIYPLHVVMLAASVVLVVGGSVVTGATIDDRNTATNLVWHLLLVDAWGVTDTISWNGPSWSVSAEWFAYLLAPLILWRAPRSTVSRLLVVVAALAIPFVLEAAAPEADLDLTDGRSLLRVVPMFCLGVVLLPLADGRRWLAQSQPLAIAGVAAAALLDSDALIVCALAWMLASLIAGDGVVSRVLGRSRLVWLGEISFAVYLAQSPVIVVMNEVSARVGVLAGWVGLVVALVVLIGASALLYRFVETPARRALRGREAGAATAVSS